MRRLAPAAAVLVLIAGCGGDGGASGSAQQRQAPAGAGSEQLHWLAATTGPAPSIAQENRQRGTALWRQGDRDTRRAGIDVYVSAQDVRPGQQEQVFVRARGRVRVRLFRLGWYGGAGGRLVAETGALASPHQPRCVHVARTGETACAWRPTLSFTVPQALPSGIYIVNVLGGARQRDAVFVLEGARAAPIVAHISTATYEAYNDWGGDSLYPGGHAVGVTRSSQGVVVSYDRPYATTTGAGEVFARDIAMVRFLEEQGYPLSYVTSTAPAAALAGARLLLDVGHSEYWSAAERAAWSAALARGVNLAFFSSDTLAWKVSYRGHEIVGYKEHAALDPQHVTGAFPDLGASLAGSAYTGCITPRKPTRGRAEYNYFAWSPRGGPLLAGTGLSAASRVPMVTGYELDARTRRSPRGTQLIGTGHAPCQSGAGVAETTLYRAPSGARVFATGTLGWAFGLTPLADPGADVQQPPSPGLRTLTKKLLAQLLGGP